MKIDQFFIVYFFIVSLIKMTMPVGELASGALYSVPLLTLLFIFFRKNSLMGYSRRFLFGSFFILIGFIVSLFINGVIDNTGIRDLMIMVGSVLPFIVMFRANNKSIELMSTLVAVIYLMELLLTSKSLKGIDIIKGSGLKESVLSMTFGLFAVYFFERKNYGRFAVQVIFLLLGLKRIALAALIFCVGIITIQRMFKILRQRFALSVLYVTSMVSSLTLGLFLPVIAEYFWNAFGTGSLNAFMAGRFHVHSAAVEKMANLPFKALIFGQGIGASSHFLVRLGIPGFPHFHDDYLKIFFEAGAMGLVFWAIGMLILFAFDYRALPLFLYVLIIHLTDNTLIYISYLVPMYMILRCYEASTSPKCQLDGLK